MKTLSRRILFPALALTIVLFLNADLSAQQNGNKGGNNISKGFIDLNGDGINDKAFDTDKDGIPNCLDSDFVRPLDGSGNKNLKGNNRSGKGGYGPGNGTGNKGIGPKDGTGNGPGSGTGNCDGTGPKGTKRGGR